MSSNRENGPFTNPNPAANWSVLMRGSRAIGSKWSGAAAAIYLLAGFWLFQSGSVQTIQADQPTIRPIPAELVTAIRNGDVPAIRKLLNGGIDVNSRDLDGNTALMMASLYAGPECVDLLLKKGADANASNKAGATPLIRAATNYDKAKLLIAAGARVQVRTADLGNTPLILAARRNGNSQTVKLLLDHGADAKERNGIGVTPIMAAAASGDSETVKLLLDKGADPNDFIEFKGPNDPLASGSRTPLMWAAYHNDVPMIRLLLDRGADPNKVIAFGTALGQAAWHDSLEAAALLIDRGARVDIREPFSNFTPLHWAASSESPHADLVKLLLAKGADPNAVGGEPVGAFGMVPQTPRLLAEKRGHTTIVEALIAAGAKAPAPAEKITAPHRKLPEKLDDSILIESTEKALAALQTTAAKSRDSFLRHVSHQDCVTCHQQYLPMIAVGSARGRSVNFDQNLAKAQIGLSSKLNHLFFSTEYIAQTLFHPEPTYTYGYELFGLLAEKVPASPATDVRLHHLLAIQAADGRWFNNLPRPPIQSNDVGSTALAVQAIKQFGWPGRKQEFDASIERARQWLWKVKAETNEESIFQLLGLHWAGESPEKLADLAKALLEKQRSDGGWAQLPSLDSDAYATGEALYALSQSMKLSSSDPAYQRGLRFLLERQEDNGTWHVARRAFPFQPTMNSEFPYFRDSWVSTAATSWAVTALAQALPVGPATSKPLAVQEEHSEQSAKSKQRVDFVQQIKPIFERSCLACHSGERPRGGLLVGVRDSLLKGGESGSAAIVPGHSESSAMIDYVSDRLPESEMPPKSVRRKFQKLSDEEIAMLRAWIDQGAEWPKGVTLGPSKSENGQK